MRTISSLIPILCCLNIVYANFNDIWIAPKNRSEQIFGERTNGGIQSADWTACPGLKVRIA